MNAMNNPTSATHPQARDWIAVEQLVQHLLSSAPDEFERDAIRLAAEQSAGPDTNIPGGGEAWNSAIQSARESLQAAVTEDLDAKQPVEVDDRNNIIIAILKVVGHADLNDFDRDRLVDKLVDLFATSMQETRAGERIIISDWLLARAERMGTGSVIVEEQARALASAAARLRGVTNEAPTTS